MKEKDLNKWRNREFYSLREWILRFMRRKKLSTQRRRLEKR